MTRGLDLSENMENYLEAILDLETTHKVARAKDIADTLGVQKGSVSGALKVLKDKALINYAPYSFITLTPQGKALARAIRKKHEVLRVFLQKVLHIDPALADATACKMEHAISEDIARRLACFLEYLDVCPRVGDQWIESFLDFCKTRTVDPEKCSICMDTHMPTER
ncbi:MAG: metal-dependent transcriptional regulator [Pseudomonadota bacterium]